MTLRAQSRISSGPYSLRPRKPSQAAVKVGNDKKIKKTKNRSVVTRNESNKNTATGKKSSANTSRQKNEASGVKESAVVKKDSGRIARNTKRKRVAAKKKTNAKPTLTATIRKTSRVAAKKTRVEQVTSVQVKNPRPPPRQRPPPKPRSSPASPATKSRPPPRQRGSPKRRSSSPSDEHVNATTIPARTVQDLENKRSNSSHKVDNDGDRSFRDIKEAVQGTASTMTTRNHHPTASVQNNAESLAAAEIGQVSAGQVFASTCENAKPRHEEEEYVIVLERNVKNNYYNRYQCKRCNFVFQGNHDLIQRHITGIRKANQSNRGLTTCPNPDPVAYEKYSTLASESIEKASKRSHSSKAYSGKSTKAKRRKTSPPLMTPNISNPQAIAVQVALNFLLG